MSGKFGLRLLSESSLIRFRGPGRYSTVHRSPPFSPDGGGSDRLESAGWKGRLISKESRQEFLAVVESCISLSYPLLSLLLLVFSSH